MSLSQEDQRKSYYERNKEKVKAAVAAYQLKHKVRLDAMRVEYRAANREKRIAYLRDWRKKNPEKTRALNLAGHKNNPGRNAALNATREAAKKQRTPAWVNKAAIRAIYAESARLTRETGIQHHVDHVVPLQGKLVSGLHVENNLQILTASDNNKKYNSWMPETIRHAQ